MRRSPGEGSVHRRGRRWRAQVTIGYTPDGKRIRRGVSGRTKEEVLRKLDELRHQVNRGIIPPQEKLTVAQYLDRWMELSCRPSVRATTLDLYQREIRTHILPHIGGMLLTKLTPLHVQDFLQKLEAEGVGARTRQIVYTILHRALRQATEWHLLPTNPMDAVTRPRVPRKEITTLDPDQVRALLEASRGDRLEALLVLALTTGMRQGELLGLSWQDVDLERGVIQVRRQLCQAGSRLFLDEPKSPKSRRRIDLPAMAVVALMDHRSRMKAEGRDTREGLVFVDREGNPIRKSNLIRRWWHPLLARAGLQRRRFHDTRHTAASLLLLEGVHPKVVQERLGHSNISLTLDTYSHLIPSLQAEAARKLDRLLNGSGGGSGTS